MKYIDFSASKLNALLTKAASNLAELIVEEQTAPATLFKSKFKLAGTGDPRKILDEEAARLNGNSDNQNKKTTALSMPVNISSSKTASLEDIATDTLVRQIKTDQLASSIGVQKNAVNLRLKSEYGSEDKTQYKPRFVNEDERLKVWKEIVELNDTLPKLTVRIFIMSYVDFIVITEGPTCH